MFNSKFRGHSEIIEIIIKIHADPVKVLKKFGNLMHRVKLFVQLNKNTEFLMHRIKICDKY